MDDVIRATSSDMISMYTVQYYGQYSVLLDSALFSFKRREECKLNG